MQAFAVLLAPEVEEDKPAAETCCIATLTFLGSYVDSQTCCSPFPLARNVVLQN